MLVIVSWRMEMEVGHVVVEVLSLFATSDLAAHYFSETGVYGLYFDKDGQVEEYKPLLTGTSK